MLLTFILAATPVPEWRPLSQAISYRTFELQRAPTAGDGLLHVVRIDPTRAHFEFGLASQSPSKAPLTAAQWAESRGFVVTINAGMFDLADHLSNVGYLMTGAHLQQPRWHKRYQSVFAFGSRQSGTPAATILDRDAPDFALQLSKYQSVVQNLRLIKSNAQSVWQPNHRQWSEALVARDAHGRILFLFTRTPYEMAELNRRLLALPLEIVSAFHAEGGPEASLSIRAPGLTLDLCGSHETGFNENDLNVQQWPVPNVIGVK